MHKSEGLLLFVLGLLLAPASLSYAQSVTVQPAMPFVGVGQTVQFSAQITGLTNTAVTWSAGGMVGSCALGTSLRTGGLDSSGPPKKENCAWHPMAIKHVANTPQSRRSGLIRCLPDIFRAPCFMDIPHQTMEAAQGILPQAPGSWFDLSASIMSGSPPDAVTLHRRQQWKRGLSSPRTALARGLL